MRKPVTKEGKLFGIINIIDLLVLLFVLAAAAVAVMFIKNPPAASGEKDETFVGEKGYVEVVFYTEEVSDFVIDKVSTDNAYVYDDACRHVMGKVTDVDVGDSIIYGLNAEGEYVASSKDDYRSAYITSFLDEGARTRFGLAYNKANYGVGHSMTIRVDDAKIYLRVFDIHAKQMRQRRDIDTSSNAKYMSRFGA